MKITLAHGTPEAYAMLIGVLFLIALGTYFIAVRFFFTEFAETLKENNPNSYLLIHFLLFLGWCLALSVLLSLIS